jgi:maltose alpha-D-glucosyltransferase/alpha-amylase
MHRALAKPSGDPGFEPEPITDRDIANGKGTIERELDETLDSIEATLPGLSAEVAERVRPLLGKRDALRAKIRDAKLAADGTMKTRFHGDLHLGQVLVAQDDFVIVDFEGEPGRSLEERRAKSSVLRDVAGMLRSFSYAAHAAVLRREAGTTNDAGLAAIARWEQEAVHFFLEGYGRAAEGVASVPSNPAAFRATLELFLIEKALYELRYEIANRPDWIQIPLRGLLEITQ